MTKRQIFENVRIEMMKVSFRAYSVTTESKCTFDRIERQILADRLNERYKIAISAEEASSWQTIADIVDMIDRKIS